MRHVWSFLAGVVAAPLTWILITLGQDGSTRTVTRWSETGTFNTANLIEPGVYLAVGGILFGLVGTLRVSPLGPLVAGFALVTPYALLYVDPFAVRDAIPATWHLLGDPLPLFLPVSNGTLFFLGALLLIATFSGQRWRRWPARPTTAPATGAPAEPEADTIEELLPARDWSVLQADPADRDVPSASLGYPDPPTAPVSTAPPTPLPRRVGGESPWSAPPKTKQESTQAGSQHHLN